jgi:Flagellar motor protein
MMTMFILFLVLFAHLHTHRDISAYGKPNTIADETIPIHADQAKSTLIFHPISQDISLKTGDKLEETTLPKQEVPGAGIMIRRRTAEENSSASEPMSLIPEEAGKQQNLADAGQATSPTPEQPADLQEQEEVISKIYDMSRQVLERETLEQFASVKLIPDKTMRIILTGDLLFDSGQAELTANAVDSLKKLSDLISKTPYMITVIGHTDDRPVKTDRFPSNWELSLARAGRVARFLIEETKLPPTQFTVSGYSSFRPILPNTNTENRRINRRVEIILSKELPQAETGTPPHLQ